MAERYTRIVFRSPEEKEKKGRRRTQEKGLYEQIIKTFISTVKRDLIYVYGILDLPTVSNWQRHLTLRIRICF